MKQQDPHAIGHVVPPATYLAVFVLLMALTAVTVWVAFYDLGALNVVVALGIAVTKATLVVLYFMHVRHCSRLTQTIVLSALLFYFVFIVLTFADYMTRGWDLRLAPEPPKVVRSQPPSAPPWT